MPEWWEESRVVAWGRGAIRRVRAISAGSATLRWLRLWQEQWRATDRSAIIRLFTGGCLPGFMSVALVWGRALTARELFVRILVLLAVWEVLRRCVASAGK
jgi:hypothetical protein